MNPIKVDQPDTLDPADFEKLNPCLLAVPISDYLQLTDHGLILTLLKIPRQIRRQYYAFSWDSEFREGDKRYGVVKAVKKKEIT